MRIGFDAKRAFHNSRGLGNYSRNLINGLINYFPDNQYFLFGNKPSVGDCANWYKQVAEKVSTIEANKQQFFKKMLWRSYFMENDIKENNIDIYHGLSHEIPFKKQNVRTKYIVTIHDLLFLRFPQNFKRIDARIYLSKIKHSCAHADLILAVSEQTRQDLINFLHVPAEKIKVNYQSCSSLYYTMPEPDILSLVKKQYQLPDKYYLFVGALVKHKNIDCIIQAVALLPREFQYPLVIVGKENAYKQQLLDVAKKCNLTDNIRFVNYVEHEHLPAFYRLADLLIWPSLFEGFGIPIIEALFCNLPVITSNVGCFPEVGGEGAYYVNPEKASDIASAIELIMSQPEKYKEMQKKGAEHAGKFHIEKTTAHLMQLYSMLQDGESENNH